MSHYIDQAGLELAIHLPLPLQYWCYWYVPPCLAKNRILIVKEGRKHFRFKQQCEFLCVLKSLVCPDCKTGSRDRIFA
jgi:hypothetical protein